MFYDSLLQSTECLLLGVPPRPPGFGGRLPQESAQDERWEFMMMWSDGHHDRERDAAGRRRMSLSYQTQLQS